MKARTYSAADIPVLTGLQPVRKRPGMYLGRVRAIGQALPLEGGAAIAETLCAAVELAGRRLGLEGQHVIQVRIGWGSYRVDWASASSLTVAQTEEDWAHACERIWIADKEIGSLALMNGASDRFDLKCGAVRLAYRMGERVEPDASVLGSETLLTFCGDLMPSLSECVPESEMLSSVFQRLESPLRRVIVAGDSQT